MPSGVRRKKSQPHGLTFLVQISLDYLEAAGADAEAAGAAEPEAAGADAEAAGAAEPEAAGAAGAEAAGAEADAAAEPEAAGFLPHAVRARASRPATNRVFFILDPCLISKLISESADHRKPLMSVRRGLLKTSSYCIRL